MKKLFIILLGITIFSGSTTAQDLYDINNITTVEITFQESNWDYLLDQLYAQGLEERLMGSVIINGQEFDSVGVRYKGNSSYSPNQVKNPFNIKLDYIIDDQEYDDYGTLKLSNVFKDPSFVREVLSYEIANKYFPASQANYANVYVNGSHMGLYVNDQSVDKFFMRTHFNSDENTRVKGEISTSGPPSGGVWQYFGTDSSDYYAYYDMKSDYGWEEFIWFLDTLNNHNSSVQEVLDVDRHLWFLAYSNLLVNLDGPINNPQNHYLYKDDNGRFNPIPWDLNESFGVFTSHQTLGQLNTQQLQRLSPFANENQSNFPVISKILSNDTYRKMYIAHMKTIMEENFDNGLYEERALELQDIITADVQADQNKFYSYNEFISNVYNEVGGGMGGGIIGITQLMETRISYIENLIDFQYSGPAISNVTHSPEQVSNGDEVFVTATVTNCDDVYLAYRSSVNGIFEKISMFDDGLHGDGQANDDVYGISIFAGPTNIQYYIYSENSNAVSFSPARAEYEFYEISITGSDEVVINEFMADNETTVTDQDGEYDDWIELYNNGTEDINLEGYYLSDDAAEPDLWMFPDTVIKAGDYLIVWADKDEEQQGLHADLKLSKSGEMILLSDASLNLLDEVIFAEQKTDTTTGRFPNGTGDFIEMLPTFQAYNQDLITGIENGDLSADKGFSLEQNRPNPFNSSTAIEFSLSEGNYVSLRIFNQVGIEVETLISGYLEAGEYTYSWAGSKLAGGMYFYTLSVGAQSEVKKMLKY